MHERPGPTNPLYISGLVMIIGTAVSFGSYALGRAHGNEALAIVEREAAQDQREGANAVRYAQEEARNLIARHERWFVGNQDYVEVLRERDRVKEEMRVIVERMVDEANGQLHE